MYKNKKAPLISICIPTYNGSSTIGKTLNQIIPQLNNAFEIIISDDVSIDETVKIVEEIQLSCKYIKIFTNEHNLGMDGNFHRTVTYATGKYVWFCGQDDLLGTGILKQVSSILTEAPDIGFLNLNFSQYDHNLENCITPSFFDRCTFDSELIKGRKILYFDTPEEYYQVFTQPPSFLPSVLMLGDFWKRSDIKQFYGTYFVQVGVLLLNLHKKRIAVFNEPMIRGRIPDDQWQNDGKKLFAVMTGDLKAKKIGFDANPSLPQRIFQRDIKRYLLNYIFLVYASKKLGLSPAEDNLSLLRFLFKGSLLYYVYILPIIYCPLILLAVVVLPGKLLKTILFKFKQLRSLKY
jgi:glycosyltransferase involved in cell wall biosynthesis